MKMFSSSSRRAVTRWLAIVGGLALVGCGSSSSSPPSTTTKYGIGGTVSGLTGTGLVLHSSTGDDLPIAADGPFTFPTQVVKGTAYEITIAQQPTSPAQTCTVQNGSGTVGTAAVTNVSVACSGSVSTYTVGGTVAGLATGATLVLQDNGGDNKTITADGAYAFATPVASGAAYAVTVLSNSANQTCTVANSPGTMGSANVTNVNIACSGANTFSIGGTVTGLGSGGTLVLQNNGGDNATVTASGSYTFATAVAGGSAYAVTVLSAPASQTCTVVNGTGTVGSANVTNANVNCTANTYSVGAMVTGLAPGGTLILQDNGGDNLTITANGPYTFATPVPSGGAYLVTVLSAPASQTCLVGNSAGTIGAAPVVASVTCGPRYFSVGGTIAGLGGTGLVLHSSVGSGEDLPVPTGATTFTFVNGAPTGTTVNVTVKTQPTAPAETCTITGSPVTVALANVTSIAVTCSPVIQRWQAPTTWGNLWPDSSTMVEHAYFDGTGIVETKGVNWSTQGGTLPAPREFKGFPSLSRWGAGPFNGPRYQATSGDTALDIPGDMLVCAIVKPDDDQAGSSVGNKALIAKGMAIPLTDTPGGGWTLVQSHKYFTFYYEGIDSLGNSFLHHAYTPTYFADQQGTSDLPPLNPSYVVVCGGRSGNTLYVAANNLGDTNIYSDQLNDFQSPSITLDAGTTPHPATIGGYDDGTNVFPGRVYETAVWNEAATPQNIQAKFAAVQGLLNAAGGTPVTYTRNREGPFVGADGAYHTTWRHGPRMDPTKGVLFGLQSWNRLSYCATSTGTPIACDDPSSTARYVVAPGEALDLWAATGGASVGKDQLLPPGDSEKTSADQVTLPPGSQLSAALGAFDVPGPVHGQIWVQVAQASTGILRLAMDNPDTSGVSRHDIDLSTLTPGVWTRIWLNGLTTSGVPGNLLLQAPATNTGNIVFYAWGVDVTQISGGGDLGAFDPGWVMYDWSTSIGYFGDATPQRPVTALDVLEMAPVPGPAASGFCLAAYAQPYDGLAWTGVFAGDRAIAAWVNDLQNDTVNSTEEARLYVEGTIAGSSSPSGSPRLCFTVTGATGPACFDPSWTPGSPHNVKGCLSATGNLRIYADDALVGNTVSGVPVPDLATGHVMVGDSGGSAQSTWYPAGSPPAPWNGYVSKVLVCSDLSSTAACN